MDDSIDLNTSGNLPDGTAASQAVPGQTDASPADLKRGYILHPVERTSVFSEDDDGGANQVGNPFTYGGFLGRPPGTAR